MSDDFLDFLVGVFGPVQTSNAISNKTKTQVSMTFGMQISRRKIEATAKGAIVGARRIAEPQRRTGHTEAREGR